MYQFILLIHVFAAICLIALVLVQQGKGATMGAAFGSGASQTVFGSRGSGSFLFRLTVGLMIVFFSTSMLLNYLSVRAYKSHDSGLPESIMQGLAKPQQESAPSPAQIPASPSAASDASATNQANSAAPADVAIPAGLAPASNAKPEVPTIPAPSLPIKKN